MRFNSIICRILGLDHSMGSEASAMPDLPSSELGRIDAKPWPIDEKQNPLHKLADKWEGNQFLRREVLEDGNVLLWPSAKTNGVISSQALTKNADLILEAAKIWVPQRDTPKTLPVDWLKHEAGLGLGDVFCHFVSSMWLFVISLFTCSS